jgi:Ca-activated chloride channel family protein
VASGAGGKGGAIRRDLPNVGFHLDPSAKDAPPALQNGSGKGPTPVTEFLKRAQTKAGDGASLRGVINAAELEKVPMDDAKGDRLLLSLQEARNRFHAYSEAQREMKAGNFGGVQKGKLGVDLSLDTYGLRNQVRLTQSAQRWLGTRNALEVGGVWIDEAYEAKMKTVTVKAAGEAYFRILERHPSVRNIFSMGNYLVWVTPSGTALVVDATTGAETLPDADIDALFVAAKK